MLSLGETLCYYFSLHLRAPAQGIAAQLTMTAKNDSQPGISIDKSRVTAKQIAGRNAYYAEGDLHVHLSSEVKLQPVSVPSLPANFMSRPKELGALRKKLLDHGNSHSPTIALTAFSGMGGIGKTVLAQALCRDERVQEAFPDGIYWQTIGRESTVDNELRMQAVVEAMRDGNSPMALAGGKPRAIIDEYRELIASKSALVVIDDVWRVSDIEPWITDSKSSRVLFTTRDSEIAGPLGACQHWAELLSLEQSREMLARWSGVEASNLPTPAEGIISQCQQLPLALAMVGAMLRNKHPIFWQRTLELLRNADLKRIKAEFPNYPYANLFVAIEASVESLEEQERKCYITLAVLLEEMAASPVIQQTLWGMTPGEAADTAERFIGLSLAQRETDGGSIRLHDLQLDYVRGKFSTTEALKLIHGAMRLSSHVITKDPMQFASQITGRLLAYEDQTEIKRFIEQLGVGAPVPWLRSRRAGLDSPGGALIRTLQGHTNLVYGVALSEDGRVAVSASADHTLKVWEVETGRELRTLTGHTSSVEGVALSRDGKTAVSASWDCTLKVWEVETGRELRTLTGHTRWIKGVAISGDGRLAVSASEDRTLKVWEVETGREVRTLTGHTSSVEGVALSGDGKVVVSASDDHTLKVWAVEGGHELCTLTGHISRITGVAVSGDGRVAVSVSSDNKLKVWEVASGRELRTIEHPQRVIGAPDLRGVAMSMDGRLAISATQDRTLKVWEVESGRELCTFTGHTDGVGGVALSGDCKIAISASDDHTLKVWAVEGGRELRTIIGHTREVSEVALSGDGKIAVSASYEMLKIWEVESGRELRTLSEQTGSITGVALSTDGKILVSASHDTMLVVWEVESGRQLQTVTGYTGWIAGVALSGDGKIAISGSFNKTLKVWEVESGRELRTLTGHTGLVTGVALSGDGKIAVSASQDNTLKVWDVENRRELRTLTGHTGSVQGVALSRDCKIAVSASYDHTLKVWEVESGRELRTLTGHTGSVDGVALSAEGKIAVSASQDNTLKVWDVESGRVWATFTCDGYVRCCTLSGSTVIVAGEARGRMHFLELVWKRGEFMKAAVPSKSHGIENRGATKLLKQKHGSRNEFKKSHEERSMKEGRETVYHQSGGVNISGDSTVHAHTIAGRDAYGETQINNSDFIQAFQPVRDIIRSAPAEKQNEALEQLEALKAEAAKGGHADHSRMTKLANGIISLVPDAVKSLATTFAKPVLSGVAGPVTQFLLSKIVGQ